jgi:predicted nucleic acid-binding protein
VLIYLDSSIVIYFVEQPTHWGPLATARLAAIHAQNDKIVVSDLTRLECRVMPMRTGDTRMLSDFDTWFASPDIIITPLPPPVFERATTIRARHRLRLADALNLAAALAAGCDLFLTRDALLSAFPDIKVEVVN